MSTRANVLLFDENGICHKQYYVHWDGYPASLGCRLIDIVNKAYSMRLHDRCISRPEHTFCERVIQFANRNLRDDVDGFLEEEDIDYLHGDIEYLYIITFTKDSDGAFSKMMCYVRTIPLPISQREFQKDFHKPVKGFSERWLFNISSRLATFEEV